MIDMIRKHTVEGSGNYRTVCDMIDRAKKMLYDSKTVSRTFVPPADHIEQVPLGSSSESSYPGYSIKEHKYGEAAQQFGNYASAARREGLDIKPEGLEYEVGQSRALSSMKLAEMRARKTGQNGTGSGFGPGSGSGSDSGPAPAASKEPNGASKKVRFSDIHQGPVPEEQMFFMDPKPTPVNIPTALNPSQKRKETSPAEPTPEPVETRTGEAHPSKKAKKVHVGSTTESNDVQQEKDASSQANSATEQGPKEVQIEYDDITAEVDKRMNEKEEKRKHKDWLKEEKKRKRRESEDSAAGAIADPAAVTTEGEKPKKKKKKSRKSEDAGTVGEIAAKRKSATDGEAPDAGVVPTSTEAEKPKKKKIKASHESPVAGKQEGGEGDEDSAKKKQKKKTTRSLENGALTKEKEKKRISAEEEAEGIEGVGSPHKTKKARSEKGDAILLKSMDGDAVMVAAEEQGEDKKKKKQKKRKSA